MVLEWTPEEASLLQDRPSLLQRQSTSQENMNHQTCACIFHTTRYTHMHEKPHGFVSIFIVIRPISS